MMAQSRLLLPAVLALLPATLVADGHRAAEFEFYRAMPASGLGKWQMENVNLASLAGVLKYVHTEVLAEHVIGNPERKGRKYGIDTIARMRFKVRNPGPVLAPSNELVNQVDFGPFVTFDNGVATNPATQKWIQEYGGYVGVQQQEDPRWPFADPYFWFSVTGWCPNVRYDSKPVTREQALEAARRGLACRSAAGEGPCRALGPVCAWAAGTCVARDPAPQCLNVSAGTGGSGHVLGGLCPGGAGDLSVEPTGQPDCTYSYGAPTQVDVDRLAGILTEDCGGRPCTSWLDFRLNCANTSYRQKFDVTGPAVFFPYCVEYDIHPACESDCSAPACRALPASTKELGLPFWRGKCDAEANAIRAKALAAAFGAAGGDDALSASQVGEETCVVQHPGICTPSPGQAGNYCTRRWGGVCTNCFIPGTSEPWASSAAMPYCPYSVLRSPDYAAPQFPPPICASTRPRDLCCLYTGTCERRFMDGSQLALNEDGFALVASTQNSTAMASFLVKAARAASLVLPPAADGALHTFASAQFGAGPRKGASLAVALRGMVMQGLALDQPGIPERSSTTFGASPEKHFQAAALPVVRDSDSRFSWPVAALIAAGFLVLASTSVAALLRKRMASDERSGPPSLRARRPPPQQPDEAAARNAAAAAAAAAIEEGVDPQAELPRLGLGRRGPCYPVKVPDGTTPATASQHCAFGAGPKRAVQEVHHEADCEAPIQRVYPSAVKKDNVAGGPAQAASAPRAVEFVPLGADSDAAVSSSARLTAKGLPMYVEL